MPIKRRVPKERRNTVVPDWATRLLAGEAPPYDSEDNDHYASWFYFHEEVPGLPPADSLEGERLWLEAERCR